MSICQGWIRDKAIHGGADKVDMESCAGLEAGLETTVDQSLMRGLATAGPRYSSRSFLCQRTGVGKKPASRRGPRILLTGPAPNATQESGWAGASCRRGRSWTDLLTNRPDEADQFARDSCDDHILRLPGRGEATIAVMKPQLRFPSDLHDGEVEALLAPLYLLADPWRTAIGPCTFDQ